MWGMSICVRPCTKMIQEQVLMDNKKICERRNWYSFVPVALEIVKQLKNREFVLLNSSYNFVGNIRYLNASALKYLWKILGIPTKEDIQQKKDVVSPFHFFDANRDYNLYFSLATVDWNSVPVQALSFNPKERKEQQELFKDSVNFTDFMFAIDFDGDLNGKEHLDISREEAVRRALNDLLKLKKLLDKYKISYYCQFSGSRGFHLFFDIGLDISVNQKLDLVNMLVKEFADVLDLKTVDKTEYNIRKVFKLPYSAVSKDKTYAVLPLSDEQLNSFSLDSVEVNNVLHGMKIMNRGLMKRFENLTEDKKIENLIRLLNDLEIQIPKERDIRNI